MPALVEDGHSSRDGLSKTTRRLAAILAADVVGYSRLIGADETGTLRTLKAIRAEIFDPAIVAHRGRLVKTTGDGLLVEFASVVDALQCATQLQERMGEYNENRPADKRIEFRIGVHQGDIVVEDGDIFGDGVNIAARLEGLAEPGGICVSARVQEDAAGKLDLIFEDLGERLFKNITRTVHSFRIAPRDRSRTSSRFSDVSPAKLSIVILPFASLSRDPEQEDLADAITDDLTTDLSRISGSFVIARNTAFTYKGKSVDAKQIGRELAVRYVLEGSIRQIGDQTRVNVQLIDAESGAHLWADRFTTDSASRQEAQDEIASRLARTLEAELIEIVASRIEQEHGPFQGRDLAALGWALWFRARSLATRQQAQILWERALEVDPGSVDARLGVAQALIFNIAGEWRTSATEDKTRAERLLLEALQQDPNSSRARLYMGVLRRLQTRWAESKIELETAIALNQNNARAYNQLGNTLMYAGQPQAAIPHIEKAIRLNPRDRNMGNFYWGLGHCHLLLGHVEKAIDFLRRATAANPWYFYNHLFLASALGLAGDVDGAQAALSKAIELKPEATSLAQLRAHMPWSNHSKYLSLCETTVNIGLERAGFPNE
jgi:adenylate cyclase